MGTPDWVVVMEAATNEVGQSIEASRLQRLLQNLPGGLPVALHSKERIAVQVHIKASDEVAALGVALSGLRAALPEVGLTDLRVVRAEVMTAKEFREDCERAYGVSSGKR